MKICASGTDLVQGCSSLFTMTQVYISKIVIEVAPEYLTPTAYFDFVICAFIYEQFGGLYAGLATTQLTSTLQLQGTLTNTTTNGIAYHTVYSQIVGSNTITLTSNSTYDTTVINILNQRLVLSGLSSSIYTHTPFGFIVQLADNSGSITQSTFGPFTITITITPSDGLSQQTSNTLSGIATFSSLQFTDPGQYLISANCPYALATSQNINVLANNNLQITVSSPQTSINSKYLYNFTATVMNNTSGSPIPFTNITVYNNGIAIANITTDANGVAVFSTYFNQSGNGNLTVGYQWATASSILAVTPSNNTDPLCQIAASQNACFQCTILSSSTTGPCSCVTNTIYNTTTQQCSCISGLFAYNSTCVPCRNYFQASEITSYYSQDYKTVVINFARTVNVSALNGCADIVIGPQYWLGVNMSCVWVSGQVLDVVLGQYPDLSVGMIVVNGNKVVAVNGVCGLAVGTLDVTIQEKFGRPIPVVSISGPDVFSLACDKSDLVVGSNTQGSYGYQWSGVYDPANQMVTDLIKGFTYDYVDIPYNSLSVGSLTIQLNLTVQNLGWSTTSKTISITNTQLLSVQLTTGSVFYTKSSVPLTISTTITQQCQSSQNSTYLWSSPSSSSIIQSILSTSKTSKTLFFASNTLQASQQYSFSVTVTQGSITASASTLIITQSSQLEVTLSKCSGVYSASLDFVVMGTAVDPDNQQASFQMTWSCLQGSGACLDSNGASLQISTNGGQLTIPKSEMGLGNYSLYLTVQSGDKSGYASIIVSFSNAVQGTVSQQLISKKIDPSYIYNILPVIEVSGYPSFIWKISGGSLSNTLNMQNPYLSFPQLTLTQGTTYQLTMDSITSSLQSTRIVLTTQVNNGGYCEGLNTTFTNPKWVAVAFGCVDLDGTDYPLTIQFGVSLASGDKWLTGPSTSSVVQMFIPAAAEKIKAGVCDCLETCNYLYTPVVQNRRRTQETLMDVIQYTQDPSSVPNVFISLLSNESDYATLVYLVGELVLYFENVLQNGVEVDKYNVYLLLDCFRTVMELGALPDANVLTNMTQLLGSVLQNYTRQVTPDQVYLVLQASEQYFAQINNTALIPALEVLASHLVVDTPPGSVFNFSGQSTFLQTRQLALEFVGLNIAVSNLEIQFPTSLSVNSTDVYDLYFASLTIGGNIYIKTKVFTSGSFISYTLAFLPNIATQLIFLDPIKVTIANTIGASAAQCSTSDCKITNVNSTHIDLELFSFIDVEILASYQCQLAREPIQLAGILIFVALILTVFFYDIDKSEQLFVNDAFTFVTFYNLTSLFTKQKNFRRISSLTQMLSTWLLILAIIGITEVSLDAQLSAMQSFGTGVVALCLCQMLTVMNVILKLFRHNKEKFEVYLIGINVAVAAISFVFVCVGASWYCKEQAWVWLVNFCVFGAVQSFGLDLVYAAVVFLMCRNKEKFGGERRNMPSEVTGSKITQFSQVYQESEMMTPRSLTMFSPRSKNYQDSEMMTQRSMNMISPRSNI